MPRQIPKLIMGGKIVQMPMALDDAGEDPLSCENCYSVWDEMSVKFFVYADGGFRCARCGTGYKFEENESDGE